MRVFRLVVTYDLQGNRRTDDVITVDVKTLEKKLYLYTVTILKLYACGAVWETCWFLGRGEIKTGVPGEKISRSKEENQQTQPT